MASANKRVDKFRKANRSNLHLAGTLMEDPLCRSKMRVLYLGVAPLRQWHGRQAKELRSALSFKNWIIEQVDGGMAVPLRETLKLLQDAGYLEKLFLDIDIPATILAMDPGDPRVAVQDQIASLAGKYALALVSRRCQRNLHLTHSWSGLQAKFCSPNVDVRANAADRLLEQNWAFKAASRQKRTFWKHLVKRSVFNTIPVQQLVAMLEESDGYGMVSQAMMHHVSNRLSAIGQEKISEDSMNIGRKTERMSTNTLQQPPEKLWRSLIDKGLVSKMYSYNEPDWRSFQLDCGDDIKLPRGIFMPKFADAPRWVADITSQKKQFFSTDPENMSQLAADLVVMVTAFRNDSWADVAANGAFACLGSSSSLVVSPPGTDKWFFCLGVVGDRGALLWPATVTSRNGHPLTLAPSSDADVEISLMLEPKNWRAFSFEWLSPVGVVTRRLQPAAAVRASPAIIAYPTGPFRNLVQEAAHQCFWALSRQALSRIAKALGCDVAKGVSIMSLLRKLIRHVLPEISEDALLALLTKRFRVIDDWERFMDLEEAEDLMDDKDKAEFHRRCENTKAAHLRMQEEKKIGSR